MPYDLTVLYFFCGIFNLILGIVTFLQSRLSRSSIAFFLFTLSVFVWILSLYYGFSFPFQGQREYSFLAIRLAYASSLFIGYFIAVFFYYFPKRTFKLPKWATYGSLLLVVILSLGSGLTTLVHKTQIYDESGFYVADELGPLYLVYIAFFLVSLLLAWGLAINKLIKSYGIEKKKIWIAVVGSSIYIFLASMTNVILPQFEIFLWQEQSVAFTLFFTVPTFYAIQKYRFFDLSYVSINLVRYLTFAVIFVASVYVTDELIRFLLPSLSYVIRLSVVAFISFVMISFLEENFPTVVNGGFAKFQNAVKKIISKMYYVDQYKLLQEMLENEFVVNLLIGSAKVLVLRSEDNKIGIPVYVNDWFSKYVNKMKWDVLVEDEMAYMSIDKKKLKEIEKKFHELDAKIIFPLYSEKKMIGMFVLGKKDKDKPYTRGEIEQLCDLKKNLEVTLMNILLKQNMQEENDLMKEIIRDKTKELNNQVSEIKRLASLQSDFLAVTAHEFRTPLSIAMFQLEDTMDTKKLPDDVADEMKVLESSLSSLKHLTQQLFDVQQFDLEKVNVIKKDLCFQDLIEETYKEFVPIMKEAKLDFEFKDKTKKKVTVGIDKSLFKQVLHNILTNAKKFVKKKDGKVSLQIEDGKKDVILKIIDNGGGIDDKNKERIFEKFQSQDATKSMGIGLGLYLCKKIIELHSGKVWVEDSKGGGATFVIKIPK